LFGSVTFRRVAGRNTVGESCRRPPIRLRLMSNAAPWATTAGNKFREVARSTENPTTKLLAEGLTALTEAVRELDANLEKVEQQVRSTSAG
jgi:hypothetical protein